jgi:hypothetical protein
MSGPTLSWTDRNQAFLAMELRRLAIRLDPDAAAAPGLDERIAAAREMSPPPAIDTLAEAFSMSRFERALLLLAAGNDLDSTLADAVARVSPQRGVTFSLALARLDEAHWSALAPHRPLRRWRLIELEPGVEPFSARLRADERVAYYLAGVSYLDPRLEDRVEFVDAPARLARDGEALAARIVASWRDEDVVQRLVSLSGEDRDGAEDVAARAAALAGFRLCVAEGDLLPADPRDLSEFARLWEREAALLRAALYVRGDEAQPSRQARRLADLTSGPLFLRSRERANLTQRGVAHFEVRCPPAGERRELWRLGLGEFAEASDLDVVASQYRLGARAIAARAEEARRRIAGGERAAVAIREACRNSGRSPLDDLATRIVSDARWEDLVLPAAQIEVLREIAAQMRQRRRVHEDWGFAARSERGLGVAVLFCGESGAGKTLAAEVLAEELGLDLYRIDLSSVVSKYIGETEKNLRRVFDAAEDSGAVLLFDEADALFGKRGEVKDSHDRYANIEVSYLLQRMEAYRGLAILTTNLKSALDTAFQRRLRFVVRFPFPDETHREAIWRRAFPDATPLGDIDYAKLAQLQVTGGSVRNIALNAAFLAAEAGEKLGMAHLLRSARADRAKLDRTLSASETRGWQ